jgi:hypothetical protein
VDPSLESLVNALLYLATASEPVVFNRCNFGVPNAEDIGIKTDPSWPYHYKSIPPMVIDRLVARAKGTALEADAHKLWRILNDPTFYAGNVPPPVLADGVSTLSKEDEELLVSSLPYPLWARVPDGFNPATDVKGVIRAFAIGEWWKHRRRGIHWTKTLNLWVSGEWYTSLGTHADVRQLAMLYEFCYSIDGNAWFNQFPYGKDMLPFLCLYAKHLKTWIQVLRLCMGQRQAVYAAQTAMRILSLGDKARSVPYVDNKFSAGTRQDLLDDLYKLACESLEANVSWNECLSADPDRSVADAINGQLIKTEVEMLGMVVNTLNKTVAITKKLLTKLSASWERRATWTVKQFVGHVSTLLYRSIALGQRYQLAKWQPILKRWAGTQAALARGTATPDLFVDVANEAALMASLEEWTQLALTNAPVPLSETDAVDPDFILITDGSKEGWCGIMLSARCGKLTVLHGTWPEEIREEAGHSSNSEPWAVLSASMAFFTQPSAQARIAAYTDNQGNAGSINKGFSTRTKNRALEILARYRPGLRFMSTYTPGATIPADGPSRGLALDREGLDQFLDERGLPAVSGEVREVEVPAESVFSQFFTSIPNELFTDVES